MCGGSTRLMCCFFFKQKTAYEMRISDWSSDVCSSDLLRIAQGQAHNPFDVKRVGGGWLVQTPDDYHVPEAAFRIVTKKAPTEQQMRDLRLAWRVARYVKSNAIVFAGQGMPPGVGAGPMSRVEIGRDAGRERGCEEVI